MAKKSETATVVLQASLTSDRRTWAVGDDFDCDAAEAERLIAAGYAKRKDEKVEKR